MTDRTSRMTGPLSWAALAVGSVMILILSPLILIYLAYVALALRPGRGIRREPKGA